MQAAMRLELTRPELGIGALAAVASMIALFMFSARANVDDGFIRKARDVLTYVFVACWVIAFVTLACNAQKAQRTRTVRQIDESNWNVRNAAKAVNVARSAGVLPRTWSCIMISLSFLSYTAPQAIRLALPQFKRLRGVVGAFSNLCFVAHLLLLAKNEASSARQISVVHLAVQVTGYLCNLGADLRSMTFTWGLALSYLIAAGCAFFLSSGCGITSCYQCWLVAIQHYTPTFQSQCFSGVFREVA
jgi:hypothetical protein